MSHLHRVVPQQNLRKRRFWLALFGALVGVAAFLCVHTGASLVVTQDAWILDGYVEKDILQHYTGWLFYRDAPLSFPLGISQSMQHPSGTAVTFTDSVPLFAIVSRLFAAILPATFQYFGVFTLCCYAAMGAGAALLLALFLQDAPALRCAFCTLTGAALFVTYPILTERAFRHTALAAQCFLVFSLYLYFLNRREGYRLRGAWFALTALSATIHPYFVPMVYSLLFADLLAHSAHARAKRAWLESLAFLAANGAVTLAVLFCIGAFSSPASDGISGYSYFCMNLNSLYNPVSRGANDSLVWSRILPAWEQGLGTYDGFNYLGLGVLLFGAAALLWKACALLGLCRTGAAAANVDAAGAGTGDTAAASNAAPSQINRNLRTVNTSAALAQLTARAKLHWPLLLVCVALTLFAVSNVLVWNGTVLFSLPIPGFLSRLGNVLRSSGRMFWPVSYLLLLATIVFWARAFCRVKASSGAWVRRSCGPAALAVLFALQLWDLSPALEQKRAAFTQPEVEFANPMQSAVWSAATAYDHIFSLDDTLVQALYPALWAAQNGLTTNDGFTARFDFVAHRADVEAETKRLLAGEVRTDTLYLTSDYARFAEIADALLAHGANVTCAWVDKLWYAILPSRTDVSLPAPGAHFAVYPDFPLQIAPLTDALWADGVLLSDPRTCIFYAGKTAQDAFAAAQQLVCDGNAYDILQVDTSDPGWVMVTLALDDAGILRGKTLSTR